VTTEVDGLPLAIDTYDFDNSEERSRDAGTVRAEGNGLVGALEVFEGNCRPLTTGGPQLGSIILRDSENAGAVRAEGRGDDPFRGTCKGDGRAMAIRAPELSGVII
jgi:hypothetical protein